MKKNQKVTILIDDDAPVKRFSKKDTGVIIRSIRTVSDTHPKTHLVKLSHQPMLGNMKVSRLVYLNKSDIKPS